MGRKLLLEHAQVEGINTYEVYRKNGGYRSVEKALKKMSPEEVVEEVEKIRSPRSGRRWLPDRDEVVVPRQARGRAPLSRLQC
jgi:NADH:ubiquinone oxidoreductase, NADH-binding (51 kD) subunit